MEVKYFVEQINVSDDQYKIIEINFENGDFVEKNTPIFSYESSKTVFEAEAKQDGYIYFNPSCKLEEDYSIGYQIAIQSPTQITNLNLDDLFMDQIIKNDDNNSNIKISKKAKILIDKHNISLDKFSEYEIVSEKVVVDYLNTLTNPINNLKTFSEKDSETKFFSDGHTILSDKKIKLAVLGAGKAALQLYDSLIQSENYEIVSFYDSDNTKKQEKLFGVNIKYGDLSKNVEEDFNNNFFDVCIISFSGDIEARKSLFLNLKNKGVKFANIIHKTAYVSQLCKMGEGNIIFANVRLGPFCVIGDNNVISASCSIEHNNLIGSHNTFGPSVLFSGSCSIGDTNKFGTMIGIEPNVKIGSDNVIASSQVINMMIKDKKLVRPKTSSEIKDI